MFTIEDDRPDNVEPHEVQLTGHYQSDPGDMPDWRDQKWNETFAFVAQAPFGEVSRVIAAVGFTEDGRLVIAGGLDLTRFLVKNTADDDTGRRLATLLDDRHRVLTQKTLGKVVMHLLSAWGGHPTTPSSG